MRKLFILLAFIPILALATEEKKPHSGFSPDKATLVTIDANGWKYITDAFDNMATAKDSLVRLQSCDDLYYIDAGEGDALDISWGGICKIMDSEAETFVCVHQMKNRFALVAEFKRDPNWIMETMFNHCWES